MLDLLRINLKTLRHSLDLKVPLEDLEDVRFESPSEVMIFPEGFSPREIPSLKEIFRRIPRAAGL